MSLINDALKRAEEEAPASNRPRPAPQARATEKSAPGQPRRTGLLVAFAMLCLVIGIAAITMRDPGESNTPAPAQAGPTQADRSADGTRGIQIASQDVHRPAPRALAMALAEQRDYRPSASDPWPVQPAPTQTRRPAAPSRADAPPPCTQPGRPEGLDPGNYQLGGIMHSGGVSHALINGTLLAPGDEIKGAHVLAIGKYHVVLEKGGRTLKLRL